jgi:hypothetical protein
MDGLFWQLQSIIFDSKHLKHWSYCERIII